MGSRERRLSLGDRCAERIFHRTQIRALALHHRSKLILKLSLPFAGVAEDLEGLLDAVPALPERKLCEFSAVMRPHLHKLVHSGVADNLKDRGGRARTD